MQKILLLGARGFLGSHMWQNIPEDVHLILSAPDKTHIPANFDFIGIDFLKSEKMITNIVKAQPDLIINCAANALPDLAEMKREWTHAVNVSGVATLIDVCTQIGAKLIQISTDYVFSGDKGNYVEDDETNPINYYGETKLDAERLLLASNIDYLICRTSVLYGIKQYYQRNVLFHSVYENLKENLKFQATTQIGNPTLVDDLANCIYALRNFKKSDIYHTAASQPYSRYEYALALAKIFGFNPSLIEVVESVPREAKRPKNSSLSTAKLMHDYNISFRDLEESFKFIQAKIS